MNFEIESNDINGNINLVQTAKKLKTRPSDFDNIALKSKSILEKEEKPVEPSNSYYDKSVSSSYSYDEYKEPEKEESNVEINIDDIINRRNETKEVEVESEPMDNDIEFAYAGRIVEPEVSDEAIDRIKSLGDDYKGENHPKIEPIIKEEVKPEYTEEDYVKLLKTDCYSPRTRKYLDAKYHDLEELSMKISNTQKEIEEITEKYKMESEIASKLTSIKKETYGIMTWINSSDFKILKNEKTNAVNNLFKSYEELFNENQQKFKKADEELEKTNEISASLGKKEKQARESLQRLNNKKQSMIENSYEKVKEVIELDNNMKKQASEMTALTGIDDEVVSSSSNAFDSLRQDY